MPLTKFLFIQGILFMLFIISVSLTGGATGNIANIIMNFLTFFTGGWLITIILKDRSQLILNLLTSILAFNAVTYLLSLGLGAALPPSIQLLIDFGIVTLFALAGMYARLYFENRYGNKD